MGFHLSALRCASLLPDLMLHPCHCYGIDSVLSMYEKYIQSPHHSRQSHWTNHQQNNTTHLSQSHRVHNSPTAQQPYDPAPMALANHSLSEKKQRFTFHPLIAYTPFRYCIFSHTCLKGRPCDPSPQYLRIPFWIWAHQSFPFMPNYPLLPTSSPSLSKRRLAFEGEVIRQHGFGCLFN